MTEQKQGLAAFDLTGKVALITGASRGIGRATAFQLATAGARVVISSRKQAACDAVAEEIRATGAEALSIAAHVGDKAALRAMVDKVCQTWGGIDILVCNAATNPVYGPVTDLPDSAFEKIITVNVHSSLWLARMVLPGMAARGGGVMILMSSIAALKGSSTIAAYGMSKAAEASLTRSLAVEWGPKGIRVNAIAPGVINTDFAAELLADPARRSRMENAVPLRRFGEASEIASIVHFLASDASSYVTGQLIVADGGDTVG